MGFLCRLFKSRNIQSIQKNSAIEFVQTRIKNTWNQHSLGISPTSIRISAAELMIGGFNRLMISASYLVISYCFAGGNLENTTNLLVITQLYTAWFIDCSKFPSRLRDDAISNQMHSQHKQQHRTWITWILDSPAW